MFQYWWPAFPPSFQCCQSKVTKNKKEQLLVDAAPLFATEYGKTPAEQHIEDEQGGEALPLTPSTTASDSERPDPEKSSMDEEERRAQKSRLNALVKSFARAGYLGVDCKVFRNPGGVGRVHEYGDAKFFLDAGLEHMIVKENGMEGNVVPVIDVVKVYTYAELMEHVPHSQVGQDLREEHRDRAVFIQHEGPTFQNSEHWLCLVVADDASRARFVTCVRLLCLYARANLSGTSKTMVADVPKLDLSTIQRYY